MFALPIMMTVNNFSFKFWKIGMALGFYLLSNGGLIKFKDILFVPVILHGITALIFINPNGVPDLILKRFAGFKVIETSEI